MKFIKYKRYIWENYVDKRRKLLYTEYNTNDSIICNTVLNFDFWEK